MIARDRGPRLILLCGLPGSGKTTLAKRLASQTRMVRLSPDEWMADLAIWTLAQDVLRVGGSVVLESTSST